MAETTTRLAIWFGSCALAFSSFMSNAPAQGDLIAVQRAYLKASNAAEFDQAGRSVAISGDTAVVGARHEDGDANSTAANPNDNAEGAGAVYVFVRDGGGNWIQQAYLKASNAEQGDDFGNSVAIDGDTVLVGAYSEGGDADSTATNPNDNAKAAGAVYVFVRDDGSNWTQEAYLKASNADVLDRFGWSVALEPTLVAGRHGGAYAFDRETGNFIRLLHDDTLKPEAALTVALWAHRDDWASHSENAVFLSNNQGGGYGFDLRGTALDVPVYKVAIGYDDRDKPRPWSDLSTLSPGWHHFAVTFDGRYTRLYVDGNLESTQDAGTVTTIRYDGDNATLIGAEAGSGNSPQCGWYFTGRIDEVRIYDRALDDGEVRHLGN